MKSDLSDANAPINIYYTPYLPRLFSPILKIYTYIDAVTRCCASSPYQILLSFYNCPCYSSRGLVFWHSLSLAHDSNTRSQQ